MCGIVVFTSGLLCPEDTLATSNLTNQSLIYKKSWSDLVNLNLYFN